MRLLRARELSDLRASLVLCPKPFRRVAEKSLIVLSYAAWEGFFNESVDILVYVANGHSKRLEELEKGFLVCLFEPVVQSLKDRNFPALGRKSFIEAFEQARTGQIFSSHVGMLKAASNLDFSKLKDCCEILSIPVDRFLPHRNFIDYELVGWRHSAAHGVDPILTDTDLLAHASRCDELLTIVNEVFEDRILKFY